MDNTKLYIRMSEKAKGIQIEKYKQGFVEGDFIWNGEKVCVCGIDWIGVKNFFQSTNKPYFMFAILEDLKVEFKQDYPMDTVKIKEGKYVIKELGGIGLWLPTQSQLQEIYLSYKAEEIEKECEDKEEKELCYKKQLDWMCSSFSRFQRVDTLQFDDLYPLQFTSMEQLWLAFVMKKKYNKIWNGKGWVKNAESG